MHALPTALGYKIVHASAHISKKLTDRPVLLSTRTRSVVTNRNTVDGQGLQSCIPHGKAMRYGFQGLAL